jgi:excisionase family DNA binding protein
MSERDVYSVPEVAARLGVDRNTAYQAIKEGQIPSIRVGHRILVPKAAFERLLEQGKAA